jgi:homocysteine S-methyltransferase
MGGQPIGAPAGFHIGVSLNTAAPNLDDELRRFEYKIEAGAEFVVTRPVFDVTAFERLLPRIESARVPVIAALLPFESARHAEFIANEVPGTAVPEALLDRMRRARPDEAAEEGVKIARDLAHGLRPHVQGLQISTSSGKIDTALRVIDGLR